MSNSPINLSPDLSRLRDEGYELEVVAGHLVVRNIPYVNNQRQVRRGSLISVLTLAGDIAAKPKDHVIMFAGEMPCDAQGRVLEEIIANKNAQNITPDLTATCSFSSKPPEGYPDFYEKVTAYANILVSQAQAIDPSAKAKTWQVIANNDPESPFEYIDSASSRSGITTASRKLEKGNIAIVGLGGTGSYVLDLIAKTPVRKIHLFDKDKYGQHNAFRGPGAASLLELRAIPFKVDYWAGIYGRMHRGIVANRFDIEALNCELLGGMDFVFLCADAGSKKKAIVEALENMNVPFIDVGMGLDLVDDVLHGTLTVTTSTPEKRDHVRRRVSFTGDGNENIYSKNIQVADLNAINAAFAVLKWKKYCGFYADMRGEHFTAYTIEGNSLLSEDRQ